MSNTLRNFIVSSLALGALTIASDAHAEGRSRGLHTLSCGKMT